jgi:hypothetical protein
LIRRFSSPPDRIVKAYALDAKGMSKKALIPALLVRRWQRNELTDKQLLEAIRAIVRLQDSAIMRELDRQCDEREQERSGQRCLSRPLGHI